MERVLVEDLVREVRVTLDENRVEGAYLAAESDHLELNGMIRSKLTDAVRAVSEDAPVGMLDGVPLDIPEAAQYMETDGCGYVVLPPDFLRLLLFKMRSWRAGVYGAVGEASDMALQQRNLFTRGTPLKPVCVLSHDLSGNRTLEYYTAGYENNGEYNRRDHRIDRGLYVRIPAIVEVDEGDPVVRREYVMLGALLRPSVVNYCAGLVSASRGAGKQAETFFNLAKSYFK